MFTFLLTCMYVGGLRAVLTETGAVCGGGAGKKEEGKQKGKKQRKNKERRKKRMKERRKLCSEPCNGG